MAKTFKDFKSEIIWEVHANDENDAYALVKTRSGLKWMDLKTISDKNFENRVYGTSMKELKELVKTTDVSKFKSLDYSSSVLTYENGFTQLSLDETFYRNKHIKLK